MRTENGVDIEKVSLNDKEAMVLEDLENEQNIALQLEVEDGIKKSTRLYKVITFVCLALSVITFVARWIAL